MRFVYLVQMFILGFSVNASASQEFFGWQPSCQEVSVHVSGAGNLTVLSPNSGQGGARAARSVLILPPIGGGTPIDMMYADSLCQKGIETWVLNAWGRGIGDYALTVDLGSHDRLSSRVIAAVHRITRQMPGRVGLLGSSAGAVAGAMAMASDSRIRVAVLIAVGADLPAIAAVSDSDQVARLREVRMRQNNWSQSEYLSHLREAIHLDPIKMGVGLRHKVIGTVVSLHDTTIPLQQQLAFERVSGARRLATYNDGHTFSIIRAGVFDFEVIESFFVRHL